MIMQIVNSYSCVYLYGCALISMGGGEKKKIMYRTKFNVDDYVEVTAQPWPRRIIIMLM